MGYIERNLRLVRERIAAAAEKAGRDSRSVRVIAVTKTMPVEQVREAIAAGLLDFGENRVQEASAKFGLCSEEADATVHHEKVARDAITLHLIGHLQRNKARKAAALFDFIHSLDSIELAQALDGAFSPVPGKEKLTVLVQVNVTGEAGKSGVPPAGLPALVDVVTTSHNLRGAGLMTIARLGAGERELRDTFAALRALRDGLQRHYGPDWAGLSMGMSDDYEIAIEEGATIVRLGRALFGPRSK